MRKIKFGRQSRVRRLAAIASLQVGDQPNAQAYFAEAARLAPADPHVRAALAMGRLGSGAGAAARAELQDKQPEQARQRFQRLLARDPRNTDAQVALAKLNRMTGAPVQGTRSRGRWGGRDWPPCTAVPTAAGSLRKVKAAACRQVLNGARITATRSRSCASSPMCSRATRGCSASS